MAIDLMPGFGAFTPSGGGLLLDSIATAPAVAYSTRKLRAAYSGSALRVVRTSDNAEQDIGFVGDVLDTASLATFIGSNTATVFKWYDQSGNGYDGEQFSYANQPQLVNAGTNNTINSIPALKFDTSDLFTHTAVSTAGGSMSGLVVATRTGSGDRSFFSGSSGGSFQCRVDSANTISNLRKASANLFTTTGTVGTSGFCVITVSTTSSQIISIDGSEESNTTSPAFTADNNQVSNNGENYDGLMGEMILWQAALTGGERTTLLGNVQAYWGTP